MDDNEEQNPYSDLPERYLSVQGGLLWAARTFGPAVAPSISDDLAWELTIAPPGFHIAVSP